MFRKRFMLYFILAIILLQASCQFRGAQKPTSTARFTATTERTALSPTRPPSQPSTKVPELKPSATALPTPATIATCPDATKPAGSATPNPPGAVQADPARNELQIVGQIGGPTRAVAATDGYAVVGVGARLAVLDTSRAEEVCERGITQTLGAPVRSVVIAESKALVAAGEAGLYIVDLTDPAQPLVLGNYDSPGYAEGVTVLGKVAYLADGPYGLRLIDITDTAQPNEISAVYELNYAFDVAVDGGHAYIAAAGAGLLVADVSDVRAPVVASTSATLGYAYGVAVSGATLFVANGWEGVQVVDISQPDQPSTIANFKTAGWAMDVAVLGEMLYIADASGGLRLVNISDRTKLTEMGSYQTSFGHAAQVAVQDETAYVADIRQGVHIVDVSKPAKPESVGLYSPVSYTQAVAVAGGYAYVSARDAGFRVIDLTDPTRPQEVAAALQGIPLASVALSGTTAYVTTSIGGSYNAPGWYPIDITDPLHPRPSHERSREGASRGVFVQGTTIYYAGEWGLWVEDLSDPMEPRELSMLQTIEGSLPEAGAAAIGVAVDGNTAYVAVSEAGLYIVDVSDLRKPTIIGVFNEPVILDTGEKNPKGVNIYGVVVAPPFAYVLDGDFLRVLDISNPRQPKALSSLSLPVVSFNPAGSAQWLTIEGNRLFIAAGAAGLLELDVSDPVKPRLIAELRLPGFASWVAMDGRYVYVASEEGGLFIVDPGQVSSSTSLAHATWQAPPTSINSGLSSRGVFSTVETPTVAAQIAAQPSAPAAPEYQLASYQNQGKTATVSSSADDGPGTLRDALERAASGDTITFDAQVFPPDAPVTIRLQSQLPSLSQGNVTLDASNAGVILDGSDTPSGTSGLRIFSSNNRIMGLQILHFPRNGIDLGGTHNTIGGDHSRGKGPIGEGNLISDNKETGISICCGENVSDNRILGNYIGTDVSGMKRLGSQSFGINGEFFRSIIGGSTPGERNVISGNGVREIYTKLSSGNDIVGNYIGLDAAGQNALGQQSSTWSVDLEGGTSHTRIERNVIARGISIIDLGSSYNEIIGNYIGTDASGTIGLGDGASVNISQPFNRIGGTRPGEGNVIHGNVGISTSDVVVVGNFLGVDVTGTTPFNTQHHNALVSFFGSDHNFLGGPTTAERNILGGVYETWISIGGGSDFNFISGNYLGANPTSSEIFPNGTKDGTKEGIKLEIAEHNVIQGNLIAGNQAFGVGMGFKLDRPVANFNIVRANSIIQNPNTGVSVGGGQGNLIVANTFTENGQNASDAGMDNHWDDGRTGNYWGDYQGTDQDGDGIGDTPYEVAPNGVDHFPLMKPRLNTYSPN